MYCQRRAGDDVCWCSDPVGSAEYQERNSGPSDYRLHAVAAWGPVPRSTMPRSPRRTTTETLAQKWPTCPAMSKQHSHVGVVGVMELAALGERALDSLVWLEPGVSVSACWRAGRSAAFLFLQSRGCMCSASLPNGTPKGAPVCSPSMS